MLSCLYFTIIYTTALLHHDTRTRFPITHRANDHRDLRVYKEQCIAKTEVSGLGINIAIYVYILCLFISTDTMILLNYMYSQGAGYLSIQKRSHRSSCQCYEIKIIIQIHRLHPHITSITQSLPPRLPKLSAEKDPPLLGGRPCPDWVQTNRHSQLLDR